jgi:glycerophosphoryl diester phosphodiesterase
MHTLPRRTFVKASAIFASTAILNRITPPSLNAGASLEPIGVVQETPIARGAKHPFFAQAKNRPEVIAHQGGKGQWPAETIYAFEQAVNLGADVLEFDIHSTRDGHLVLMHNNTVDETTNGTGRINRLLLSDLKKLDAGYRWTANSGKTFPYRAKNIRVATLQEVLERFPDKRMNIEIKQSQPSIVAPLCALIEKHNMSDKVLVASFSNEDLKQFRVKCPKVATSASPDELLKFQFGNNSFVNGVSRPDCLQVKDRIKAIQIITRESVATAHRLNLPIHAWTVNDIDGMKRMIALEVDGIITDYPGPLLALLDRCSNTTPQTPAGLP